MSSFQKETKTVFQINTIANYPARINHLYEIMQEYQDTHFTVIHQVLIFDVISTSYDEHDRLLNMYRNLNEDQQDD